ncbi:hypothetical protein FOC1_h10017584, partial [Fusarium oxysporum f. sp. cubense race 1]
VLIVSIVRLVSTVKVDEDLDFTYSLGYGLLWRYVNFSGKGLSLVLMSNG